MWVFSADWTRSEWIECQEWAHFSGEWINSNTLRAKEEFHALVTSPDTVIHMGPACVSADLSVFPEENTAHFPPVTPRRIVSWRSLLFHPPPQAGRTSVLDPALKSDPALSQSSLLDFGSISECLQGWNFTASVGNLQGKPEAEQQKGWHNSDSLLMTQWWAALIKIESLSKQSPYRNRDSTQSSKLNRPTDKCYTCAVSLPNHVST